MQAQLGQLRVEDVDKEVNVNTWTVFNKVVLAAVIINPHTITREYKQI